MGPLVRGGGGAGKLSVKRRQSSTRLTVKGRHSLEENNTEEGMRLDWNTMQSSKRLRGKGRRPLQESITEGVRRIDGNILIDPNHCVNGKKIKNQVKRGDLSGLIEELEDLLHVRRKEDHMNGCMECSIEYSPPEDEDSEVSQFVIMVKATMSKSSIASNVEKAICHLQKDFTVQILALGTAIVLAEIMRTLILKYVSVAINVSSSVGTTTKTNNNTGKSRPMEKFQCELRRCTEELPRHELTPRTSTIIEENEEQALLFACSGPYSALEFEAALDDEFGELLQVENMSSDTFYSEMNKCIDVPPPIMEDWRNIPPIPFDVVSPNIYAKLPPNMCTADFIRRITSSLYSSCVSESSYQK